MNTRLTFILMLCSLIVATAMHQRMSAKKDNPIDKVAFALNGVRPYIGPTTNLRIDNRTATIELLPWSRYILVPAFVDIHCPDDTMLTFISKDSTLPDFTNRKIAWQYADDNFHYILSTKQ